MTPSDLVGQRVISEFSKSPMIYKGDSDSGWNRVTMSLGAGISELEAEYSTVAPADIEIPESSDRIEIVKHAKKPASWVAGPWQLLIDGAPRGWHRIKREAMAEGLRYIAIQEWHEQQNGMTK